MAQNGARRVRNHICRLTIRGREHRGNKVHCHTFTVKLPSYFIASLPSTDEHRKNISWNVHCAFPLVLCCNASFISSHVMCGLHYYWLSWSRIHERTISLRFLGIILRALRLEISVNNVYITNKFQTTFAQVNPLVEVTAWIARRNNFVPITAKNSASGTEHCRFYAKFLEMHIKISWMIFPCCVV